MVKAQDAKITQLLDHNKGDITRKQPDTSDFPIQSVPVANSPRLSDTLTISSLSNVAPAHFAVTLNKSNSSIQWFRRRGH